MIYTIDLSRLEDNFIIQQIDEMQYELRPKQFAPWDKTIDGLGHDARHNGLNDEETERVTERAMRAIERELLAIHLINVIR